MEGLQVTEDTSALVSFFTRLNAVRVLSLASFVILIYDHALSLRREVSHVWPLRFSLPKLLFLLNRYCHPLGYFLVLLSVLHPSLAISFCGPMGFFAGFYNTWIIVINGAIGTIRTWALYGRSPTILAYSVAFVGFQTILFTIGMSMDDRFVASREACVFKVDGNGGIGKHLKWVAVFMDSGPLALVAWRTRKLSQKGVDFPLVQMLYRDCSIALILFFVGNFSNYLAFSALVPVNMIFTHPITTSTMTHLVLNMHELFYKQSLADLDINSDEAPLDLDSNGGDLGFASSDSEWVCDCPLIFDEAETITEENGAAISSVASIKGDPEKAVITDNLANRQRYHTETCLLRQRQLSSIRFRHNAARSNYHLDYYRRPRAKHLESMVMTFGSVSEDQEHSQVHTVGTLRGAIFGGMLLGLEVTTPGTGLTRTSSNHSFSGLSLFGAGGWGFGGNMSRTSTLRRSNGQSETPSSKRLSASASRIGHTRAASTSDGHTQLNLLHPKSAVRILPSPPVRKLPSLPARSGTISSNGSHRRSTITFIDVPTGPLSASSYASLATPMAPTTSRPKLQLDISLAQAQMQNSRKRSRRSLPIVFVAPVDAPPLPNALPVPPRSRPKVKGGTRPLPHLPSLTTVKPLNLPKSTATPAQSQEQDTPVSSQLSQGNETEFSSHTELSSAQIRLLPLPPSPAPLTRTPIRRLPTLPQQEEAFASSILGFTTRNHSSVSVLTPAEDGLTTVGEDHTK